MTISKRGMKHFRFTPDWDFDNHNLMNPSQVTQLRKKWQLYTTGHTQTCDFFAN